MQSVDRGNGHVPSDGQWPADASSGEENAADLESRHGSGFARRIALVAILVAGLLGLIGLASRPAGDFGSASDQASGFGMLVIRITESLGILTGVAGLILLIAVWPGRRKRDEDKRKRREEPTRVHWAIRLALMLIPFLLLGGMIALLVHASGDAAAPQPVLPAGPMNGSAFAELERRLDAAGQASPSFGIVFVVVTSIVAASVGLWLWKTRPQWTSTPDSSTRRLKQAVDDGLDALQRESDPRRAVILAYLAMERALAMQGLARMAPEAPVEYMLRILADLPDCQDAVHLLTALFEEAKFSHHSIDSADREAAVQALIAVRAALGQAT